MVGSTVWEGKRDYRTRWTMEIVRQVAQGPVMLFTPPPPARNLDTQFAEFVAAPETRVRQDGTPVQPIVLELKPIIDQYGISPANFRLKVWRVHARIMRKLCDETGITFCPPPTQGLDADGFIRPEMVGDLFHANENWGTLLFVSRQRPPGFPAVRLAGGPSGLTLAHRHK